MHDSLERDANLCGAVLGGRYEIGQRIGGGSAAWIHMATDRRTGGHVAVKVLHPDHASDPKEVRRFVQEAQLGAQIRHPNLIPAYDFGGVGGCHYIVMELVDGQSVAHCIQAGRLDPKRSASLVLDLLYAAATLHERGIVHRDISPSNVMIETVDGRERARLADLGIARKITEQDLKLTDVPLTKPTMVCGTDGYIAPECVRGARNDFLADLYSIGAVWYAMITGYAPPFLREGDSGAWPPLTHKLAMPAPLRAVLLGALDERAKRHPSAASMAATLRVAMDASARRSRPVAIRFVAPALALILSIQVWGSLRPVATDDAVTTRASAPALDLPPAVTPAPTSMGPGSTLADFGPSMGPGSTPADSGSNLAEPGSTPTDSGPTPADPSPTLAGPGPTSPGDTQRPRRRTLRTALAACKAGSAPLEVVLEPGQVVEINGGPPFGDIGRCVTRQAAEYPPPTRKLTFAL